MQRYAALSRIALALKFGKPTLIISILDESMQILSTNPYFGFLQAPPPLCSTKTVHTYGFSIVFFKV